MLKRVHRRYHITPVLKDLHCLRINERIEFKILILTHRAFYETGPMCLSELINFMDMYIHCENLVNMYLVY